MNTTPSQPASNATLAAIAPSIAIETIWSHDEDAEWDIEDPSLDPDDFQAWQSEVRASAIVSGKLLSGSAYLGGTWERFGDHPSKSNPDISGYFPQMLDEALADLANQCPTMEPLISDARAALTAAKD